MDIKVVSLGCARRLGNEINTYFLCACNVLCPAIIVTDPNDEAERELESMYDDEEAIFLQDWYHENGQTLHAGLDSIPFIWVGNPQSFAINGGGLYLPCFENTTSDPSICANNCSIENYIKTINVESGKTYRFRLIGGACISMPLPFLCFGNWRMFSKSDDSVLFCVPQDKS